MTTTRKVFPAFLCFLILLVVTRIMAAAEDPQSPPATPSSAAKIQQSSTPDQITADPVVGDPPPPAVETIIVVTGTFQPVPLDEINRAIGVIEVRDTAPLHHYWTEALQSDASIDLRQRGGNGVQGDLSLRGSTFGQTLVLLDGLRVNDAQTAHHNLDVPVPLDGLERVEVLRGAGSTIHGADAMGGAVNFITSTPKWSELRFGSEVGNFGVNSQKLAASFLQKGVGEHLTLWRDFSSGFRPDRDYRNTTAFSHTDFTTSLGSTTILLGISDKPFGADQFYCNCNSFERTKAWFTGLRQGIGKNTEFDLGYRRHTDEFVLFRDKPSVYENNHIDESYQFALRRHQDLSTSTTLSFGGEGFHDSIDSNNLGQHSRARGAGYVNLDARSLGRFSLSLGAREEFYGSDSEFTPSVAAGYVLGTRWKLKGSVSRGFRIPTYTDLYYTDPFNQGNPNLKPESGWNYEGGVVWNPGGRWKADATVFHSRQRDVIDYVQTVTNGPYVASNLERLNFTGIEATLSAHLSHNQQASVSYTAIHGAQGALQGLQSRYTSNYPTHRAVVGWIGELPGRIQARSQIGVVQRYSTDPYAVWDAAVSREFYGRVRANLGFSNIADTRYQEIQNVVMPGQGIVFGLDLLLWQKRH
jgi:iron complex outermembrane receptor protein